MGATTNPGSGNSTLQGAALPIATTGSPQFPRPRQRLRGKLGTGCTKSPEPLPSAKDVDCDNIADPCRKVSYAG